MPPRNSGVSKLRRTPSADFKREHSRMMLGNPVLGPHPRAPAPGNMDLDLGGGGSHSSSNAWRDQVRAAHLVDELRVYLPPPIIGELFSLNPDKPTLNLLGSLRRSTEAVPLQCVGGMRNNGDCRKYQHPQPICRVDRVDSLRVSVHAVLVCSLLNHASIVPHHDMTGNTKRRTAILNFAKPHEDKI